MFDFGLSQSSKFLEPDEVRAIIESVSKVSRYSVRDIRFFELLWQSGARVSEALSLLPGKIGTTSVVLPNLKQYKRVKTNGKTVRVRDYKATKEIEVSEELCLQLKSFCKDNHIKEDQFVFQPNREGKGHLCRSYVWWILGKASLAAGVRPIFGKKHPKTGGRFKGAFPHMLRHSNAMYLLEQTGDISIVKEQLGHALIRTTQGYA